MNLGFSFGTTPTQSVQASPQAQSEGMLARLDKPQSRVLLATATIAAQVGVSSYFNILASHRYVSRMAILPSGRRDDDTFSKKRQKGIIRRLKVEASEASNDKPRDQ